MRNKILVGLGIAAAVLLFFQNCGMNNNESGPDDSRLLVTPLADSGISIAQGENPFAQSGTSILEDSQNSSPGQPVVPENALSDLIAVNSPTACVNGYKPTEFFYARNGFTSAGTGGFLCQLPTIAKKDNVVSDVKLQTGTTCPSSYSKIGTVSASSESLASPSAICVQYQPVTSATSYFTVIYATILDTSLPALRCKTGDRDAGNFGTQFALCLHR